MRNVKFSFDSANPLDWSNDLLKLAIAVLGLLSTCERRPEAESFRNEKIRLKQEWLKRGDPAKSVLILKKFFNLGPLGISREQTQQSMSDFLSRLNTLIYVLLEEDQTSVIDLSDPVFRQFEKDFLRFCFRYKRANARGVGGIWLPDQIKHEKPRYRYRPNESFDFIHEIRNDPALEYFFELVRLFCKAGLICCLVPILIFESDLSSYSKYEQKSGEPAPSLDGLLGHLFPRKIDLSLKENKDLFSQNILTEWLLLMMNRDELRRQLGTINSKTIHSRIETWGYCHGQQWYQEDLDMLFDRLFLGLSVEKIAENRFHDPLTVIRHTGALAKILHIKIPRANPERR